MLSPFIPSKLPLYKSLRFVSQLSQSSEDLLYMSQDPASTEGGTSNKDVSKKRSLGVLGQDNVVS